MGLQLSVARRITPPNPERALLVLFDRFLIMPFANFITSDSGAVTVDWVVLAAAIAGFGLASVAAVRSGVAALGGDVSTSLGSASVASLGALGASEAPQPDQCPADWVDQLATTWGFDPADAQSDIANYAAQTDDELIASLLQYTRDGGWGIDRNENNVQAILCAMSDRGLGSTVRVF